MVKFRDTIKYPDNKGNTMFETIVAFFILTIILALIFQMIAFCGQLRMKAADTSKVLDDFNQDMYRSEIKTDGSLTNSKTVGTIEVTPRLDAETGKGPLFYLTLSDETSKENLVTGNVSDYQGDSYRLRLTDIHANTLVSNHSLLGDFEHGKNTIIIPKAVQFYHRIVVNGD